MDLFGLTPHGDYKNSTCSRRGGGILILFFAPPTTCISPINAKQNPQPPLGKNGDQLPKEAQTNIHDLMCACHNAFIFYAEQMKHNIVDSIPPLSPPPPPDPRRAPTSGEMTTVQGTTVQHTRKKKTFCSAQSGTNVEKSNQVWPPAPAPLFRVTYHHGLVDCSCARQLTCATSV